VGAVNAREAQLETLRGELRALDQLTQVGQLGRIQLERTARECLTDWQGLLAGQPVQARQMLRKLLEGRLVFTPMADGTAVEFRGPGCSTRCSAGLWMATAYLKRANPVGDSNPCVVHGPVSSDHQRRRIRRTVSERERAPVQASCLSRCGGRVTKTVTTGRDSPLSRGVTPSHRVTGNPSILLTRPHGTARHSQLPRLDVAVSIPVARSILAGGYSACCSPPSSLLPKCCPPRTALPLSLT
jgi:hypothetical protein